MTRKPQAQTVKEFLDNNPRDVEDIVERLNNKVKIRDSDKYYGYTSSRARIGNGLLSDAITTIQSLRDRVEELEGALRSLLNSMDDVEIHNAGVAGFYASKTLKGDTMPSPTVEEIAQEIEPFPYKRLDDRTPGGEEYDDAGSEVSAYIQSAELKFT